MRKAPGIVGPVLALHSKQQPVHFAQAGTSHLMGCAWHVSSFCHALPALCMSRAPRRHPPAARLQRCSLGADTLVTLTLGSLDFMLIYGSLALQ